MKQKKRKVGRPAVVSEQVRTSIQEPMLGELNRWSQEREISRTDALRHLISIGLAESLPNDLRELVKKPLDTPTAEEIRQLRKEASLTQSELGEIAGTTGQAVKQWEAGEYQPRPAVWRFIEVYIFLKKNNFL
ncbi:helix-turn-helix domain-containing protein [Acetobacteraceae bacterium]|nr:helix-turn-helix domain-containing protein [Acetobacteraceae bacterium]